MSRGPGPCPSPDTCGHLWHCPRCKAGSCAPGDAENGYCGACGYTGLLLPIAIVPSADSIAAVKRSVAQFNTGLSRLGVTLKSYGVLAACLNGDHERARALLSELDDVQLPALQDAATALALIASRLQTGERDEGQDDALNEAWLLQVKAEGIADAADKIQASGTSPYPHTSTAHPVWARATAEAADTLRLLADDQLQRAAQLRASATAPNGDPADG